MNIPVKVFTNKIKDEYGMEFNGCLIAIRGISASSQITLRSENCTANYTIKHDVEPVVYQANYWGNATLKQQGFKSRPLKVADGDEFTDLIEVDMNNPEVERILASNADVVTKHLLIAEADIKAKYK